MTREQIDFLLAHGLTKEQVDELEAEHASMAGHKQKKEFSMPTGYVLPLFQSPEQRRAEEAARKNRNQLDIGWRLPVFEVESQPAPVSDGVKSIYSKVEKLLKQKQRGPASSPLVQYVRDSMDAIIKENS